MNFKFFLLIFLFISCGLKTKPVAPHKTALPSIPESYYTHLDDTKEKPQVNEEKKEDDSKK